MDAEKLQNSYDALKIEYQVCKRKLDSKCEALQILTRDLDISRQQRDQFKLMAEQVQQRYQGLKRQLAGVGSKPKFANERNDFSSMKSHSLAQMLTDMREYSKQLQFERDDYLQKLTDAQGDIKLLREQIARNRVGATDEGMNTRHFPAHERQKLVKQLEESHDHIAQLERDVQQVLDEKQDQETERDGYKTKYESLNKELNHILKGDVDRVTDIDAMINENKFLKNRLDQMREEKDIAHATVLKYKSILDKRKQKGILKVGQMRSSGVVISQKQVSELLHGRMNSSPQMIADLQSVASALLETVNDKNIALSHQRKTNRILGSRVSELEQKVKTLEVSGIWNTPEKLKGLDKLRLECEEIKNLLPVHCKDDEELDDKTVAIEARDLDTMTSASSNQSSSEHSSPEKSTAATNSQSPTQFNQTHDDFLHDLDFLPTKDGCDLYNEQTDNTDNPYADYDQKLNISSYRESDLVNLPSPLGNGDFLSSGSTLKDTLCDYHSNDLVQGHGDLLCQASCDLAHLSDMEQQQFEDFIEGANDHDNQSNECLESEYDKTSSHLNDLMEEMTLKVTERSRLHPVDNVNEEVSLSSDGAQLLQSNGATESSDKSPLLAAKENVVHYDQETLHHPYLGV